jgi:hypothetical protein
VSNGLFGIVLVILGIFYGLKDYITDFLNKTFFNQFDNITFKSEYLSYLLFALLMATLVFGMLSGDKIVQNYGNVSAGFENLKPSDRDRPNPLFDIDTYW